jgi:hypothetical protein
MLRRARRYDDDHGYRDYMTFEHLMGASSTAWQMFPTLLGRYSYPHIWTSAFVGLRVQQTSRQDLMQWIRDMAARNQTSRQRSFPARFDLLCFIDRPPDFEFADFIDTVDDLSKYQFKRHFVMGPDRRELLFPEPFGWLDNIDANNFKDYIDARPISALRLSSCPEAYSKYASGHGIRGALILNPLRRRPKSDFLQFHQICRTRIEHGEERPKFFNSPALRIGSVAIANQNPLLEISCKLDTEMVIPLVYRPRRRTSTSAAGKR